MGRRPCELVFSNNFLSKHGLRGVFFEMCFLICARKKCFNLSFENNVSSLIFRETKVSKTKVPNEKSPNATAPQVDAPKAKVPKEKLPKVKVSGPYGECHQEWYKYEVVVMIGAGIGITPYASILNDLIYGTSTNKFDVNH